MSRSKIKWHNLFIPLFFLIGGSAFAQIDTLSFLHITDLHVILNLEKLQPDLAEYRRQKGYHLGEEKLKQFLQNIPKETNSDFVIATGDMVDFFEAEGKNGEMRQFPTHRFSRLIKKSPVPVLLVLGNHDIFSFKWQVDKLSVNQYSAVRAKAVWTKNISCFKNGNYYSKTYIVGQTAYRLIFLDDSFYRLPSENIDDVPYLDKQQLRWLNAQFQESDDDIEIILMHIPFTENDTQPESSNALYEILSKNESVKLVVAGHNHKNIIKKFPGAGDQMLVQVQTGALVADAENWRQIHLTEDSILVSAPGKIENELKIPLLENKN